MRFCPLIAILTFVCALAAPALAQQPEETTPEEITEQPLVPDEERETVQIATPGAATLTRADVEAWLDGFMPYALADGGIAGAVVVVVGKGEVVLQKGYGLADVEENTPVDPESTLFRPGSVSKLFTWTAVMQLVEDGRLDLDTDVNEYLDFEIPEGPSGEPITLRDIMTHTAGFEERLKSLIFEDEAALQPLGESLASWVPERIFRVGTTPAYSNYATGLAGYIVERVSGQSFDDYLDAHIFEPLGMANATFRQPLPERFEGQMSAGYATAWGDAKAFELVNPAPAGSLSASGSDMAKFMLAHLQQGSYDGVRILEPETVREMHRTMLTMIPPLHRMALGFYESDVNGRNVIAHGGDTQWFHSDLNLFIDDGVGLFISMNSAGRDGATSRIRMALYEMFADRYLPGPEPSGTVDEATAEEHAAMMAGTYVNSRRAETSFLSALGLVGQVKVIDNGDGTISVPFFDDFSGKPTVWREIAPFVWLESRGEQQLAAVVQDGVVRRFSIDGLSPFMVFDPAPWWKSSSWLLPLVSASLVALLLTALLWPVKAIVRRRYAQPALFAGADLSVYRWTKIASIVTLAVIAAWMVTISTMFSDLGMLSGVLDAWLMALQLLSLIVLVGSFVVSLRHAWRVWTGERRWPAKVWSLVLVIAFGAVLWVALVFHLIGFDTHY
ncbi:MAG TPA: serine hydrolase domain-containing protein [Woeseiaceae bacterium]|nr:serine hydrolase domain-containing protein [Woeseiaceae bacterium]